MLFELTRNRLERVAISKPVVGLRLLARELPPFVPAARDLFDVRAQQALPWPQLRERLRARLGDAAVYRIGPTGDPRPERAWTRVDGDAARIADAPPRPPRPAWLLPRPLPLRDPRLRIVSGPERLESGWWDGEDARRDYYVLETSRGPARLGLRAAGRARWLDAARVVRMSWDDAVDGVDRETPGGRMPRAWDVAQRLRGAGRHAANDDVAAGTRPCRPTPSCTACRTSRSCAARPVPKTCSSAPLQCGYEALAITDECSLAGIVRGLEASRATGLKLIVGSEFTPRLTA